MRPARRAGIVVAARALAVGMRLPPFMKRLPCATMLCALAGCLAASSGEGAVSRSPADAEGDEPLGRAAEPFDIGRLAFLLPVAGEVTSTPAPQPAPAIPQETPVFAPSEHLVWDDEVTAEHASVASFCAWENASPAYGLDDGTPPGKRACREIAVPVPFKPDKAYLGVAAVRVFDGAASYSLLLLKTSSGWSTLPVAWGAEDPSDPGCPSIVRKVGVERIGIDNGILTVMTLGEDTTWVDTHESDMDGGARGRLVRQITIAKVDGATVHTRSYTGFGAPVLGHKIQPRVKRVAWSALPWVDRRSFEITDKGLLLVDEPR
ncbi:MAG: hypothetical protein HOW73_14860 [Polyangiaceae bacterium]|nr:hypothetical protein [Polyangiaceae bacterium]